MGFKHIIGVWNSYKISHLSGFYLVQAHPREVLFAGIQWLFGQLSVGRIIVQEVPNVLCLYNNHINLSLLFNVSNDVR